MFWEQINQGSEKDCHYKFSS